MYYKKMFYNTILVFPKLEFLIFYKVNSTVTVLIKTIELEAADNLGSQKLEIRC